MVSFQEAKKMLREGKKIHRPDWKKGNFWFLGVDEGIKFKQGEEMTNPHIHLNQLEANDWQIYEEDKDENLDIKTIKKDIISLKKIMYDILSRVILLEKRGKK